MRKQTKLVAALSATALLAIGASAVSFAAGWNNTTGTWQYLDNDGNPVADAWKKSGDYWFYLGSDGNMATNEVVQNNNDFYYVNQDGAMVTNQWVAFDTDSDSNADHRWMYFGADGKAYRDTNEKLTISDIRTINGKKYLFDQEGYMLYGWLGTEPVLNSDDNAWATAKYYYGGFDDGSAQHGWVQLTVTTDSGDDDTAWFYFNDNGEMSKNKRQTINGKTYYFREDGRMIEDWSNLKKEGSPSVMTPAASGSSIVYVNGDGGARKNQWVWAVPSKEVSPDDYENENYSWWYADNSGKVVKNTVKRIKSKFYAFNEIGQMLSGLQVSGNGRTGFRTTNSNNVDISDMEVSTYLDSNFNGDGIYFFSDDGEKDGSRKTGYQKVGFQDDDYQMYFLNNGKAANGYVTKIKKYVNKGVILAADNDTSNYGYVAVVSDTNVNELANPTTKVGYYDGVTPLTGSNVLVNAAGTKQTGKFNLRDANDNYYVTDKHGLIKYAGTKKLYATQNTDHPNALGYLVNGKPYYTE